MRRLIAAGFAVVLVFAFGLNSLASASVADKGKPKKNKAEQSLIDNHVPPNTASSCSPDTKNIKKVFQKDFPSQKANIGKVLAAVACSPSGQGSPDTVLYIQFDTLNAMLGVYGANLPFYNLSQDTQPPSPGTCPEETTYDANGQQGVGRVLCVPSTDQHGGDIIWTNDRLKIYSEAFLKTDPDGSLLHAFFAGNDSGPEG
jgi:hypothetical protein